PARDWLPQVAVPARVDHPRADVADIDLLPVELPRRGRDIILHVLQELVGEDLAGLEVDAAAVTEAEVDRGAPAGGMRPYQLELAPGAEDLVDVLGLDLVLVPVGGDASLQLVDGPIELPAVLEDRRQGAEGLFPVPGPGLVRDRPEDPDEVELIGE